MTGTQRDLPPVLARLGERHPLVIAAVLVTVAVTVGTAAVTLAGFLADRWWVFDILTSFRPQAIVVLAVATVALIALRVWWVVPVALLALVLNLTQVMPVYREHAPAAVADSPTLTVAHLNLQSNAVDVAGLQHWLAGHPADIVVFLDAKPDLAAAVRDGVDGYSMVYPKVRHVSRTKPAKKGKNKATTTTTDPSAATSAPSTTDTSDRSDTTDTTVPSSSADDGTYVVYDPTGAEEVVLTDRPDVTVQLPATSGLPESAVELHATIGDQAVSLLGLHTQSPTSPANHTRRDRHLDAVTRWLQDAPAPAIAFGDFNVTYYSPFFQRLLDRSGARSSQLGFGVQASWPVQFRPAGIGIDQSVYTGGVTPIRRDRGPSLGSEHRILIVTYALAAP